LREYYEFWVAFDEVDASDDGTVSFKEFEAAKSTLESWGIDMSNPKA